VVRAYKKWDSEGTIVGYDRGLEVTAGAEIRDPAMVREELADLLGVRD
jgi:hypothetical protein